MDISTPVGGRGLKSLITRDDVITGSGLNRKFSKIFGVFDPTEFDSELRFRIVYGPSLRSASGLTLVWVRVVVNFEPTELVVSEAPSNPFLDE